MKGIPDPKTYVEYIAVGELLQRSPRYHWLLYPPS
jgi:hypothetical protein